MDFLSIIQIVGLKSTSSLNDSYTTIQTKKRDFFPFIPESRLSTRYRTKEPVESGYEIAEDGNSRSTGT